MKQILTAAIIVVALSGCSKPFEEFTKMETTKVCDSADSDKRATFILQCIKNANPKSDEEPEDWLYKCERFSDNLFCMDMEVEFTCYDKQCWKRSPARPVIVN
jgi:hypothetical protein